MKAVIMAGGEGTRLRGVTGGGAKPMVPLLGRPIMEHIILLLKKHGFCDICAALKYRAEDIKNYFGTGDALGVKLQYRTENEPLGTAGAVKNCADFYGNDDFLVISGDAACDFDLAALMRAHREKGSLVTLAVAESPAPLGYGLVIADSAGYVRAFTEKPAWPQVVTNLVNTGIYVLSPRALDYVPGGAPFDFARNLFPLLLARSERIFALTLPGYWRDIGTPESYYRASLDALTGKLTLSPAPAFVPTPAPAAVPAHDGGGEEGAHLCCPCRDRAAVMRALSSASLDLGASFENGLTLARDGYRVHISPVERESAVRVSVFSPDSAFARALTRSLAALIGALGL